MIMSKTPAPLRILIVEDDPLISMALEITLEDMGCHAVGPVTNTPQALELIAHDPPDGAVVDINLENSNGLDVAAELSRQNIPFILASGRRQPEDILAEHPGAVLLLKPFGPDALERHLLAPLMALRFGPNPYPA